MSRHVDPPNSKHGVGPLFVRELAEEGVIEDNIFATYYESLED
jgi:hypothetical protein